MEEQKNDATDTVHKIVRSRTDREDRSKVCEPCKVDNTIQPATGWCETCDEMLCDDCYKAHCRHKMMKNHQLWSITEMENRKQVNKIPNKCQKHGKETLRYYCEDHKQLGCNQCFVSKHRHCRKVVCISEVTTIESNEFKALQLLLSKLQERLNSITEKKGRNVSITRSQHDEAIVGIQEAGEKLKTLIDNLVKEQVTMAEMTKDDNIKNIDKLNKMNKETEEELAAARNMLATVTGDNNQLFITAKHLQGETKVLESKLDALEQSNTIKEYQFVLNPELARLLDTVIEFGTLKDTQELNMEKATDEVVDEFEVLRFPRVSEYFIEYNARQQEAIQISTDRDIRLMYVLLYPCYNEDMNVELTIFINRQCLISCTSTNAKTDDDVVAMKVVDDRGVHGIILHAGHRYNVYVRITGHSSHEGYTSYCGEDGQAVVKAQGVTFSFSTIKSSEETSVLGGQLPGFRFELQ